MVSSSATQSPATSTKHRYVPRVRNQLHTIFERHFDEFCDVYDEKYAATYGMFRLDRIRDIGERFLTCGDYRLGVARIRCPTSPQERLRAGDSRTSQQSTSWAAAVSRHSMTAKK